HAAETTTYGRNPLDINTRRIQCKESWPGDTSQFPRCGLCKCYSARWCRAAPGGARTVALAKKHLEVRRYVSAETCTAQLARPGEFRRSAPRRDGRCAGRLPRRRVTP